ncbi:MAG: Mu transposase C-terminal domain-containing protein [Pseudomonadota bacterium]
MYHNTGSSKDAFLKGQSPYEALRAFEGQWNRVDLDPQRLLRVFTTKTDVALGRSQFRWKKKDYVHKALAEVFDRRVTIRAPKYHHFTHIEVLDRNGNHLCYAETKEEYKWDDVRGAQFASELNKAQRQAIQEMAAGSASFA